MFKFIAYSKNQVGKIEEAALKTTDNNGVLAVYADSVLRDNFDTKEAIKVKIEISDEVERVFTVSRISAYWAGPKFVDGIGDVPDETIALFLKKKDGTYAVVVPVVAEKFKTVLCGEEGAIYSKTYSWYDKSDFCDELLFVCTEGRDLYKLISSCFEVAVKLLGNHCKLRDERVYPEFMEYLGWCSWDSIPIFVTEDLLKAKCEEFKEKNIPVKWAIIDDTYAEVHGLEEIKDMEFNKMVHASHSKTLYSLEADPERFPNGLAHAVDMLHNYGLDVGIWMPPTGYWHGLDPEGDAYKELGEYTINSIEDAIVPDYVPSKSYMYFKTAFDFLKKSGVDFMKIDNQALPYVHYRGMAPVGETARGLIGGMEAAVNEAFSGKMINCMGMATESMWNRTSSPIARCSDDFRPENRKWFRSHILQCTYNGLVQGQLYYHDFDMWWTDDEQAKKNSLLRAVSGGPIYVSDKIGRSNREIFDPLVLKDGRILRCERTGVPTEDCLFDNPINSGKIFKVQNTINGSGVIAAFNLNEDEDKCVTGTISPKDVCGLTDGEYGIFEYFSWSFSVVKYDESIDVSLKNADDFKLYIIVPLKDGFGAIGRIDKFISPATVSAVHGENISLIEDGPYAYVKDGKLVVKE